MAVDLGRSGSEREFLGLADCLRKVFKNDGIRGLYSGFGIAFVSIFTYRGLYFGVYDFGKTAILTKGRPSLIKIPLFSPNYFGRRSQC